jgi:hypothetical protein
MRGGLSFMRAFPSELRRSLDVAWRGIQRERQWHNVNYGEHTSTTRKATKNFGHRLKP